ncbi:hypothetical protein BMS3Abin11_00099 [bacterium BMS3Abin11]|nr:hypothetical protein BMS3Abin11_00099 [bacterium BMS3Abin11]
MIFSFKSLNTIGFANSTDPHEVGASITGKAFVRRIGYCLPGSGNGMETRSILAVLTLASNT